MSRDGNHVFRVPMLDPETIPSGTGSYPWRVTETSGTFVYLKNATDHELEYHASLNFPGGHYALGRAKIAAHETVAIDVRALRDAQRPDATGNVIPADAQAGQFLWSIHGTETKSIIGRAEQADFINGFSSSYACYNCCGDVFERGWVVASVPNFEVGGTSLFTSYEEYRSCYGGISGPWQANAGWNCSNETVATWQSVTFSQVRATGLSPGFFEMFAQWSVVRPGFSFQCELVSEEFTASAPAEATPPTPDHVKVIRDNMGFPTSCPNTGIYLRQILVQIVNKYNVDVTSNISVEESFTNLTQNTCGNGVPQPEPCQPTGGGRFGPGQFLDSMAVAGNDGTEQSLCTSGINRDSGCGYTVTSTWSVCGGGARKAIWKYNGETRSNIVRVDGKAGRIADGTHLFP